MSRPRQLTDEQCRRLFRAFSRNQRRCEGQHGTREEPKRCKTATKTLRAYERHCQRILY